MISDFPLKNMDSSKVLKMQKCPFRYYLMRFKGRFVHFPPSEYVPITVLGNVTLAQIQ